ncbi:SWIM zinc finger family protein [Luedemannella flava]
MSTATYTYLRLSGLADGGLTLQTSGGVAQREPVAHPRFFSGFVTTAEPVAAGLLAVAEVARTRYFQPLNPRSLDPVVTGSRDRLRFESFSGCCGVYARMDVLPAALDGETPDHGTTNVDVNAPLRTALARVAGSSALRLDVGPDDLTVTTMHGSVVEKKVPLPTRWLRGFAEVQVIASRFDPRIEVSAAEATAFLRRVASPTDRTVLWVVPSGRSLRLTSRPVPGAVCLPGQGRLAALRPLLRFATTLRAYGPPVTAGSAPVASTWELQTPTVRVSLTLSPEPARGFSGEGAVLTALATDEAQADADLVGVLLAWDPTVDVDALAAGSALPADRVRAALTQLGTAGRVGYDVSEAAYFHRVLPTTRRPPRSSTPA